MWTTHGREAGDHGISGLPQRSLGHIAPLGRAFQGVAFHQLRDRVAGQRERIAAQQADDQGYELLDGGGHGRRRRPTRTEAFRTRGWLTSAESSPGIRRELPNQRSLVVVLMSGAFLPPCPLNSSVSRNPGKHAAEAAVAWLKHSFPFSCFETSAPTEE